MKVVQQAIWTPAGSVSAPVPMGGGVAALPAVDSQNASLLVTNTGGLPAWFTLQTDQVIRAAPGTYGTYTINPGASLLFAPSAPADFSNTASDSAIFASIGAQTCGNPTLTRGTITPQTILAAANG